jgi:large subunit ribosomal protein L25
MDERSLVAQLRTEKGKEKARNLRRQGLIPAVVYGQREETIPVTLNPQELFKVMHEGAGERTLINLTIEGLEDGPVTKTVILKEKQIEPLKRTLLHVDLYTITMDEEIHVSIPVHIVGKAQGVELGGVMEQVLREIEIECLPGDIPPRIDIDVSSLDIGDSIHVSDITLEKAKILIDPGQTIVTVVPPVKEEVVEVVEEITEEEAAEEGKEEEAAEEEKEEETEKKKE